MAALSELTLAQNPGEGGSSHGTRPVILTYRSEISCLPSTNKTQHKKKTPNPNEIEEPKKENVEPK